MGCIIRYQHSISDMIEDPQATVADSAITNETLALSVYSRPANSPPVFEILVFRFDGTKFYLSSRFKVDGDVTALCISSSPTGASVLAGLSQKESSTLAIYPVDAPSFGPQIGKTSSL